MASFVMRVSVVAGFLGLLFILVLLLPHHSPNTPSSSSFSICPRDAAAKDPAAPPPLDLDFEWTIFITPQGFVGPADRQQRRAIQSWMQLKPRPKVVLVGQGEGYEDVAKEFGLTIDPRLDMNFVMMPLAGSLVHLAMSYPTEIACIVNSDILLTQSFADALSKVRSNFVDWFFTGARYDLDELPHSLDPSSDGFDLPSFNSYVRTKGVLHTAGGLDFFVWNNNGKRLIQGVMPPFIRGKSKFDNWFAHEIIQAGDRDVIDGTDAALVVHVIHNYQTADGKSVSGRTGGGTFWQKQKTSNWMIFHNNHLSLLYGSYRNQDGTSLHAPWKLSSCHESFAHNMCLQKRMRPGVCPCEHNAFAMSTQTDPEVVTVTEKENKKMIVQCGRISQDAEDAFRISVATAEGHTPVFGLPFTMRDLLPLVTRSKTVIVTGVTYAYRDILMNFVCNMRRLGMYDQLIIAAFDEETYRFGFRMGLPVFFYDSESTHLRDTNAREAAFGSEGFKSLTKLKSQIVLQILRAGYDVVWTDTDIIWYRNPLPLLAAMPSDLVVQSNAPWPDEAAANGPLRINSGFYRARSTPLVISAFDAIVAHARRSSMSEQPSFYIVLCGGKEGTNIHGDSGCLYHADPSAINNNEGGAAAGRANNGGGVGGDSEQGDPTVLNVQFLNRQHYPNGAVGQLWDIASNISSTNPEVVILHNNWIRGLRSKIRRIIDQRLWWYDRDGEMCDYSPAPTYELSWNVDEGHGEE